MPPNRPAPPRCKTHPESFAGWHCDACKKALCGKCAAQEAGQFYCCHCEGVARQLTVPRTRIAFLELMAEAIVYPVRRRAISVVALAFALAIGSAITAWITAPDPAPTARSVRLVPDAGEPADTAATTEAPSTESEAVAARPRPPDSKEPTPLALILDTSATFATLALFFLLTVSTRSHGDRYEPGAWLRVLQGWLATAIVWAPGLAYLVLVHRDVPGLALLGDWLAWLFLGLAMLYLPIAVAVTSGDVAFAHALSPFRLSEDAWRVRRRYGATLLILVALAGVALLLEVHFARLAERLLRSHFLADLVVDALLSGAVLAAAHLVGSIGFVYGYEFGWGKAEDFHNPLLPDVRADGTLKRWTERLAALSKPAVAPTPGGPKSKEAQAEAAQAREIAECLKTDNLSRALKLYEARPSWSPTAFDAPQLLGIATAAVRNNKAELATRLLGTLVERKDVTGGRALLALAQLHSDKKDAVRAADFYRQAVQRFPGTDVARFAEKRLAG